jgi:dipeptidase D
MTGDQRIQLPAPWTSGISRRRVLGVLLGGTAGLALTPRLSGTAAQATPTASAAVPLRDAVAGLAPRAVWERFFQITQIPRPSHHEARISAFLAEFGRGLGLETAVDDAGNVLLRKPATPGMDDRVGVVLQSHMDMVPVKRSETVHDFETDPIAAYVEDGWVRADGTTLGADDGIGLALIMALLEAQDVEHGPLEALFTVNEEDGFTGASSIQPGILHGRVLLNVDSEVEGEFTIGSAGGVNVDAMAIYAENGTPAGWVGVQLAVKGLQGGHSGIDIGKGRGNAIKLLARLLKDVADRHDLRLASLSGGDRYNAIPRETTAVVAVPAAQRAPLIASVEAFAATVRQELIATEPELRIVATATMPPPRVMVQEAQRRFVDALDACPNGVIRMSDTIPGLVETSTNVGTVTLEDGRWQAGFLVRSAVDSERDAVRQMIERVFALAGAETAAHDEYSGWQPNRESPLLKLMSETYRHLFGKEPKVGAVHAGLETSMIGAKYPGLDMISVGPTMENVHSPDERLEIASVGRVWELLVAVLKRVPEGGSA